MIFQFIEYPMKQELFKMIWILSQFSFLMIVYLPQLLAQKELSKWYIYLFSFNLDEEDRREKALSYTYGSQSSLKCYNCPKSILSNWQSFIQFLGFWFLQSFSLPHHRHFQHSLMPYLITIGSLLFSNIHFDWNSHT